MKIDTGEILDIVYTTNVPIVTTLTDGHASVVIPLKMNSFNCYTDVMDDNVIMYFNYNSDNIATVHLLFKGLWCNKLGKLYTDIA